MNDSFPSKVFVENAAPKARHMKARGKCEARRPGLFNMCRSGVKGRHT